jgi:tripartite-type tricarboxylate transporter receptor subunit TctC
VKFSKLCMLVAAAVAPALGLVATVSAQGGYPNKPIKLLVPFTPGGGTDQLARIVAQKMSESMGQQIIVENKPGGNTLVATEQVVRSAPDGYTLIMQTNNLAANPTLYKGKMTFDTMKDLVPVSLVAGNPHVLVVNPSLPVNNLKEYIALAKAKPGTITFATAGSGTVNHLTAELLKMQAGIDIVHVPYKGSGSVMPDLLGGNVNSLFAAMPTVTGYIKEKRLRPIAVTTPKRFAGLPDVPTIAESGYPGYDFSSWFGILAPAGTPKPIVDRLQAEVVKALADPTVQSRLGDYVIYGTTSEEFGAFIKNEIDKTGKIIEVSGAKID